MRLITIRTPAGASRQVADMALQNGIKEVAISTAELVRLDRDTELLEVVNIETATPVANRFMDLFMAAPFYDPKTFSFTIRHPESLFGAKPPREEIHPIVRPTTDVYQELYQFTKVTVSLAGRVFLSAVLVSYGMVEDFLPLIIAGLLFLPYHHHMLGVALGGCLKEWQFLKQALWALLLSTALIFLAGVCVSLVMQAPVQFQLKGSPLSGIVFSAIIGVAAALASIDDAGRRELIGLAATAHISIYPAWLGLHVVLGIGDEPKAMEYLFSFAMNVVTLILAAILTFALAGIRGEGIRKFIRSLTNRYEP